MAGGGTYEGQAHFTVRRGSERNFGLVFAGFFSVLASLAAWEAAPSVWIWAALAALLALLACFLPRSLALPNRLWHSFGLLLGGVVSPIVMGALYFLAFTPLGLMMRLSGKDPLRLRWDRQAASYWIAREPPGPSPDSMPLQF